MASINRLQPGQVVYSVTRERAGNTTMTRTAVRPVYVVSVDLERRRVEAQWNGNEARIYTEAQAARWKVNKPRAAAAKAALKVLA